jgi:Domain of unknown function (DUF4288)
MSDAKRTHGDIQRATFGEQPWYAVRCVFEISAEHLACDEGEVGYEERITLWQASSFDEAIELAEAEGHRYQAENDGVDAFTGLAQAYHLFADPAHGAEVFSLLRRSSLDNDDYLARYFDTGNEGSTSVE